MLSVTSHYIPQHLEHGVMRMACLAFLLHACLVLMHSEVHVHTVVARAFMLFWIIHVQTMERYELEHVGAALRLGLLERSSDLLFF